MSINTKITLKTKSGPGEIVGKTELEMVDGYVEFTKIQFTEPGDYVVSVVPSNSEELELGEFEISVSPQEEFIPQEDSDEVEDKKIDGVRPIIAQITQPTIKLDPMEFETSDNDRDNADIGSSIGYTPFVWYNGIQIQTKDIIKLFLYYDNLVPKCKLTIIDTLGLINTPETMPLNDTKFEIFFNSGSELLKSIHLKFKLEINQLNKNNTNSITGTIDLVDFYKGAYESNVGTSYDVLKKVSSKLSLGFNSNIGNTSDEMKWIRRGSKYSEYISNIIKHSYISDNSFLMGYVDFYWCFNYIDLEKEWTRDISSDVGVNSQGISSISNGENLLPMVLTNDKSDSSSSFYFSDYRLNNNSTYRTTNNGVFTTSKVYDRIKKQFLKFDIDSITSNADDNIILKGAPSDSNELKDNFISKYGGKIDTDNVHENYQYSVEQNRRNLENLDNISIDMTLPQPNFNIYLYQKVEILFINEKQTVVNEKIKDERLSGGWLITDISFVWINGSLKQRLSASRKELGKTKNEREEQRTSTDKSVNNSEINENPVTEEVEQNIGDFVFGDEVSGDNSLLGEEYTEEFGGLSEEDMLVEELSEHIGSEVNLQEEEIDIKSSDSYNGLDKNPETWSNSGIIVIGSKVPSDISGPPKVFNKITINNTIKEKYIPIIEKMDVTIGTRLLATIMTQKEGFKEGTRSFKTNNPGNIGNIDNGSNKELKTLEDGIELQIDYINKVAVGKHTSYPIGKKKLVKPYYSKEISNNPQYKLTPFLPGYEFNYSGKIEEYVKIYSTGARVSNSYISMIVSWFNINGYNWVNSETTIKELTRINNTA